MIKRIRHKGLERFYRDGDTRGINAQQAAKLRVLLTALDTAIGKVNSALGYIGASQSRMENAVANLKTTVQNYSAAESTIRDVDMADEMVTFSKNNILAQAGTAILAQAKRLLRVGGLAVFDSMLFDGRVADAGDRDAETVALRDAAAAIKADDDWMPAMLSPFPSGGGRRLATERCKPTATM